ncbi:MAG: hypothetical protein HQL53_01070 [Magnetococcales bacterium]|nr:hypothetical protein [Magnetococcales bacterium]
MVRPQVGSVQALREVEALRFLYLGDIEPTSANDKATPSSPKTLLVITDFIRFETEGQLRMLAQVIADGACGQPWIWSVLPTKPPRWNKLLDEEGL